MFNVKSLLAATALASAVVLSAGSASAAYLKIDDPVGPQGQLKYDSTLKVIQGKVGFNSIQGIDTPLNDGVTIACPSCVLTFTSGTLVSGSTFGPGGIFELKSGGTSLLSATFTQANAQVVNGLGGLFAAFLTDATITYAPLAAFFGISPEGSALHTDIVSSKGVVQNADLYYAPVPVPAALPLFLSALAGVGLVGRRSAKVA